MEINDKNKKPKTTSFSQINKESLTVLDSGLITIPKDRLTTNYLKEISNVLISRVSKKTNQLSNELTQKVINSLEDSYDSSSDKYNNGKRSVIINSSANTYNFTFSKPWDLKIDLSAILKEPIPLIIENENNYDSTLLFSIDEEGSSPIFTFDTIKINFNGERYIEKQIFLKIKSAQEIKNQIIPIKGILYNEKDHIKQIYEFSFLLTNQNKLVINSNTLKLELSESRCKQLLLQLLKEDKNIALYFKRDDLLKAIKESEGNFDKTVDLLYA